MIQLILTTPIIFDTRLLIWITILHLIIGIFILMVSKLQQFLSCFYFFNLCDQLNVLALNSLHQIIFPNYYYLFINITYFMTSILRQTGSQLLSGTNNIKQNNRELEIQQQIKAEVWRRHIRIKYFFEDFDKLRKGFCNEDKFRSALSMALYFLSINLTQEQLNKIVDKYRIPPGDLIKHSDFVACIDQQFSNHDQARQNLQNTKSQAFFNEGQADLLDKLLKYIKYIIATKRVLIKPSFQDYDRTKSCHITKDQFGRVLNSLGLYVNERLYQILCKKYVDNGNQKQINYVKFVNDVENIKQTLDIVNKGIKFIPRPQDAYTNIIKDPKNLSFVENLYLNKHLPNRILPISDILRRIQAEVVAKRVRIREFFLDFDGLRKNIVTGEQFKRVLNMLNVSLSEDQYSAILNQYRVEGNDPRIKWMDFCEDIDLVWTTKGIDKDPLYKVSPYNTSLTIPARRSYIPLSEQEEKRLNHLLGKYKKQITSKRILLKPHFEDFDITKIGYITKNQFLRILDQFGVLPNQAEIDILLKKYVDKGNLHQVNYYQFVRDVDNYNQDGKIISNTYAQSFIDHVKIDKVNNSYINNAIPNDLNDLLAKIRKKVKQQRIRISQFLRDFDKLRSGTVTKDQFRLALTMCKIILSEAEYKLILDYFNCPDKVGYIKSKQFVDVIDEVFTKKELQKQNPLINIEQANTNFIYGRQPITSSEAQLAQIVKDKYRSFSLTNRMDIKHFFQDWDKLNRYKVSPKQFRQVLATASFLMTQQQFKAISKVYATEDGTEVRYIDFLNDTRPYNFDYMTETKQQYKKGTGTRKEIPQNIQVILDQIRKITKITRIRYKEYFQDFDPLRKGTAKKNKFRSVLFQTMKLNLQDKILDKIQSYYQDPNDNTLVNYMQFLEDIDLVFTIPERQKDPLTKPPVFDYTVTNTYFNNNKATEQAQELERLLTRLGEVVRKHKLLLKPHFQDKDIAKSGKVSFTRMRAILDYNKLPLTDLQYKLLCKRFSHEGIQFNYVQFDEVLKTYEKIQ